MNRSRLAHILVTVLLPVTLCSCATRLARPKASEQEVAAVRQFQLQSAFDTFMDRQNRASRIEYRLATGGADLCERKAQIFGLFFLDPESLPEELQKSSAIFGFPRGHLYFWDSYRKPSSFGPSLDRGATIIEINGRSVEKAKDLLKTLDKARDSGTLLVTGRSATGEAQSAQFDSLLACPYPVHVLYADEVNAFADGNQVFVTTGLLRLGLSDDELAVVLGHEIAHNALGHIRQKKMASAIGFILGSILDVAAAVGGVNTQGAGGRLGTNVAGLTQMPFSQVFESEADYMGIYLAARAGFDPSVAPGLWNRMAAESPASTKHSLSATHPSTPERAASLQEAIAEIHAKQQRNEPLIPENKRGKDAKSQ